MKVISLTSAKDMPPLDVEVDQFRGSDGDLAATRRGHNEIKNNRGGRTERLFNMRMNIARKSPGAAADIAANNAAVAASSGRRRGRSGSGDPNDGGGRNSRPRNERNHFASAGFLAVDDDDDDDDINGRQRRGRRTTATTAMANYDKFASSNQRSSTDFGDYDRSPSPPPTPAANNSKFGPKSVFSKSTFKSLPTLRGRRSQQQVETARRNGKSSRRNNVGGENNGDNNGEMMMVEVRPGSRSGSGSRQSRSRSRSSNPSVAEKKWRETTTTTTEFKAHPWILPPYLRLAPRVDVWFAFAVASCAAVSSIGQIKSTTTNNGSGGGSDGVAYGLTFTSGDDYALSICAVSFMVALGIAAGMRYAPMRTALTKNIFPINNNHSGMVPTAQASFIGSLKLTVEFIVLSIMSFLWMIAMPIIVNGNAHYSASKDVPLAMAGTDIWNANLYYSSWASFLLCAYLWVEVFTLTDRRGTLKADVSSGPYSSSRRAQPDNVFTKRWSLLVLTSVILMSASIGTYTSPSCKGTLLKQTSYCSRALLGILIGGLFQLLIGFGVAALYRLSQMSPGVLNSQLRRSRGSLAPSSGDVSILSVRKRNLGTTLAAIGSLIVQAVNAGLLTSPTGGGPGNISGTLYFGSWLGFALAFELCLRYLELFGTSGVGMMNGGIMMGGGSGGGSGSSNAARGGGGGRSTTTDTPTVYDDEEDEESLMMPQQAGPEIDTQPSVSEEEMNDAQSFVFSYAMQPRPGATPLARRLRRQDDPSAENGDHYRRGVEPEEFTGERRKVRSSSGGSSGSRSRGRRGPPDPDIQNRTSDPSMVGSIDARSFGESRSGDETSGHNDPDGEVDRRSSRRYDSLDNMAVIDDSATPDGYSDASSHGDFFDRTQKPRSFHNNTRRTTTEPPPNFTSFHMDRVEKLDEIPSSHTRKQQHRVQPEPAPSAAQIARVANQLQAQGEDQPLMRQSTGTNLSPLEEGQEEISPTTGSDSGTSSDGRSSTESGPPTLDGESEDVHAQQTLQQQQQQQQREVGDNLRTMQAMRGAMNSKPMHKADRSKKSGSGSSKMSSVGASTRSGSRSGSREKSRLSGSRGYASGGQASRASRQSKQSTASRRTKSSYASTHSRSRESAILTDQSEQDDSVDQPGRRFNQLGAHSKPSAKSMPSTSTISSHVSTASAIMTDSDESGSNPPPTISDGLSSKGSLSGFSSLSKRSGSPKSNQRSPAGPPPPPFRRAAPDRQHDYGDATSQHSGSAPVRSIQTNKGSRDSDTIVSDPTLDMGLDQSPKQNYSSDSQTSYKRKVAPPPPRQKTLDGLVQRHSSSTTNSNSYDKKYSDETDMQKSSVSDENPSSQEGEGGEAVDTIVAAALAYAEKTHSESDPHAYANRGSGITGPSLQPPLRQHKSISMPHQPLAQNKYSQQERMSVGNAPDESSASLHSFFTESDTQGNEGGQQSMYEPQSLDSAPVEDLVTKALSHAQGQLDAKHLHNVSSYSTPGQQQRHQKSEYSGVSGKSVGSMYSQDDTEFSNQDVGVHYDC